MDVQAFVSLLQYYGYPGLFGLLMVGIVGLPVPDETLLSIAGYLAFRGIFRLPSTYAVGFLGSACGISLSYGIGRFLGVAFVLRFGPRLHLTPELMEKVQSWFARRGKWTLTFGYFFPGVRHFTAIVAGSSKLKLPTFCFFAYLGALIWSGSFVSLGYVLGEAWSRTTAVIHRVFIASVALFVLVAFITLVVRRRKRKGASSAIPKDEEAPGGGEGIPPGVKSAD